jgi:ferredoxin
LSKFPPNLVADPVSPASFDLLRTPILGKVLSHRQSRLLLQIPLLLLSVAMVLHGLLGPTLAPKNLATTLSWVHFRGVLVLLMLIAGNFFCFACPFMLARQMARRFFRPKRNWPRILRSKWLSLALFVLVLFTYELFDLWSSPWWTAWLIIAYFVGALLVDCVFKHASFCKYVCPIGQFNYVASTISPLEVKVRDQSACIDCRTKDCIRGRRDSHRSLHIIQRGCELGLFQPAKIGNMDCTFCLDCVYACPHDNVGIISRMPASELMTDPPRSGVGYFSRRKDLSALVTVFTFGALLNAFGMVSPVYALQRWLAGLLHLQREAPGLGLIFVFFLVVEPLLLIGLAAWLSKKWGGAQEAIIPLTMRYSYGLVPLGFAVWLSHYSFHFLTGIFTFIPVMQSALASIGLPILGEPYWTLVGIPQSAAYPLELGFLGLGLIGSLLVSYRLTDESSAQRTGLAFAPWAGLCVLLWVAAMWLMSQPMEMRGNFMGG